MKEFRLRGSDRLLKMIHSFSATEKVVFGILITIAIISSFVMAWKVNAKFLIPVPAYGGSFTEGMMGLPRSINPVLAFTEVDKDLTTLIYSGLMKYENNELVPDLAESYSVSEDGLVYTFKLKDDIRFHDNTSLTTEDIEFTIQKVEDGDLKSPRRADWASVGIKKINEKEIQFILKQPYAPFLANTTLGIIPKHLWKNLDADQFIFDKKNLEPIGSGPYKVDSFEKDSEGIPVSYKLSSFNKYHNGRPFISEINVNFYPTEDEILNAYEAKSIENFGGLSAQSARDIASSIKNTVIVHNPLPRIFGVFLNQNNAPVLANKEVRQALNMAVDKEKIVSEVLYNYGVSINGPLPVEKTGENTMVEKISGNKQGAVDLLTKNGWQINADGVMEKKTKTSTQILELSIATADSVDLKLAAEMVKKDWESIGARVTLKVFEYGDLSQNIIKTRKYDALLFGEIISKESDLYAFWHSSQRNSPGLNISMYVNSKVDKLLEDARITYNKEGQDALHKNLQKIISDDVPAVFLYSPEYIYFMSDRIKGYSIESINNHSDRFYGIEKWFINTNNVWKIFINEKNK